MSSNLTLSAKNAGQVFPVRLFVFCLLALAKGFYPAGREVSSVTIFGLSVDCDRFFDFVSVSDEIFPETG